MKNLIIMSFFALVFTSCMRSQVGLPEGESVTGAGALPASSSGDNEIKPWTRLTGTAGVFAQGEDITVDSSGNSYVTGVTDGKLDGQAITGHHDVFVIKYNASGVRQWTRLLGVSGNYTRGIGIAVDPSGNSYATGFANGDLDMQIKTGLSDAFVIKYDPNGVKQWTKLSGSPNGVTQGFDIAVDPSGNSYVTGYTDGNLDGESKTGLEDAFVIKYNSSGVKQWTRLSGVANGQTLLQTMGTGIGLDASGNIYVSGYTQGKLDGQSKTGATDVFVIKYNASGVKQWTRLLGDPGAATQGRDLAVDPSGNSYVTGEATGNLDGQIKAGGIQAGGSDVFVIKYNSSGVKQWARLLGGVPSDVAIGYGIAVDSSGNSYITGLAAGNLDGHIKIGIHDIFVIKYSASGVKQWTKFLGVPNGANSASGIALDPQGNNYVTGYTESNLDEEHLAGIGDIFVTTRLNE